MVLVLDVPLTDTATLDAFADALVAAGHVLGAPFVHTGDDAHPGAEAQRFLSPAGVTVELVDDYDARARYVDVLAVDPADAAPVAEVFRQMLPVASTDTLVREATDHLDAFPGVLLRLALGTPLPPPVAVVEAVQRGLVHDRAEVRLAAVEAVGLIGLPPFLEAMQHLRTDDPDEYVRGYAEQTVRLLHG